MGGGVDLDLGGNQDAIADGDAIAVEDNAVVVDEYPCADGDVEAVVAAEGGLDFGVGPTAASRVWRIW